MSTIMSDRQFRQAVVSVLGQIAEDVNEILEHLRWNRESNDDTSVSLGDQPPV